MEFKYSKRLKPEKALWAMKLELANYSHLCYIDNGLGDQHAFREKALEICRVFEKEYEEIKADLSFFQNLIDGPHQESDFINLPAGEILGEDHFQNLLFGGWGHENEKNCFYVDIGFGGFFDGVCQNTTHTRDLYGNNGKGWL